MNKSMFLAISLGFLSACSGPEGNQGMQGAPGQPAPVVAPVGPTLTESLVNSENDYRMTLGQAPLTSGLACTLYTVPSGSSGILTATGLVNKGSFLYRGTINSPDSGVATGVNLLPPAIRQLYTSWYELSCVGKLVVEVNGYYSMEMTSDDGSLLYLDGALLLNNDGNHGATTVSGMKYMRQGVHDITAKYMSGPGGNQAWVLKSSGVLVPAINLFH